jgi:hypothetical protein
MNDIYIINTNKPSQNKNIAYPVNKYNLKHGVFEPMQNSPPSIWKTRLINRVDNIKSVTK